MLPKKNRADKKAIEIIFKKGFFVNSGNLTFKYIANFDSLPPRISFLTPKTASKKAVFRNTLRRKGYIILKKYFHLFPAGLMGVFVFGKNSTKEYLAQNLELDIQNILKKLKF